MQLIFSGFTNFADLVHSRTFMIQLMSIDEMFKALKDAGMIRVLTQLIIFKHNQSFYELLAAIDRE